MILTQNLKGRKFLKLNNSQKLAETKIVNFLLSDKKVFLLEAPSGFGKSFLMNHICVNQDKYASRAKILNRGFTPTDMPFLAPTNKAAGIGLHGQTIHKYLKLRPTLNTKTGKYTLIRHSNVTYDIGVIDEFSQVTTELNDFTLAAFDKVIFVGDSYQLPPVGEKVSPVLLLDSTKATLTEPMRQDKDSNLFQVCCELREMIRTNKIGTITLGSDVKWIDQKTLEAMLPTAFKTSCKVITFSNDRARMVNNYMRKLYGNTGYWQVGERVVFKSSSFDSNQQRSTIEHEGIITDSSPDQERVCVDGRAFNVAKNHQHIINKCKDLRKNKQFNEIEDLKSYWLDLRLSFAGTCHSAQGSTYDSVFIDLGDFNTCRDLQLLLHLLYTGVSRAKHKVYLYGNPKYRLF